MMLATAKGIVGMPGSLFGAARGLAMKRWRVCHEGALIA